MVGRRTLNGVAGEAGFMGINAWLAEKSLRTQALIGATVVAIVTFALNYSSGPVAAAGTAAISGAVIGFAYYLGLRVARD